jgi:predicted outer membrane repeat protein
LTNALASATNSDVIWLSSGTYTFTAPMEDDHETYGDSCLLIPTNVTVRSISGVRSSVILDANGIGRVARLEDAESLLMGVTITNGVAGLFYGGGIYGGGASNCIISGNAGEFGGGSYNSALDNCTVSGNSATDRGGGVYGGTATNSIISGNSADINGGGASSMTIYNSSVSCNSAGCDGGGLNQVTLYNSIISGNSAASSGGGINDSTIYDSTISSNCAAYGGGVYYSTIYRCIVFSNSASSYGGGVDDTSAYNCLILTNAANGGGGACAGTLYNCVLSGNSATGDSGGSYLSSLYNCISWDNNKVEDSVTESYSCGVGYTGTGSITNDPLFVGSGDYRLQAGSPCINAGTNSTWTTLTDTDLDGNKRRWPANGQADMGAYEFGIQPE